MKFSLQVAVWFYTQLQYDKTNDKSTAQLASKGFKEENVKALNVEVVFVSDFETCQAYYIARCSGYIDS